VFVRWFVRLSSETRAAAGARAAAGGTGPIGPRVSHMSSPTRKIHPHEIYEICASGGGLLDRGRISVRLPSLNFPN